MYLQGHTDVYLEDFPLERIPTHELGVYTWRDRTVRVIMTGRSPPPYMRIFVCVCLYTSMYIRIAIREYLCRARHNDWSLPSIHTYICMRMSVYV